MRFFRKRFWCILLAVMMIWVGFAGSSVSAASAGKQITIIPNTDEQPSGNFCPNTCSVRAAPSPCMSR